MAQLRLRRGQQVELLRGIALFAGCTKAELARISSLATETRVGAGTVLTREGDIGRHAFILIDGAASAYRKERRIAILGPGSLCGELALLDGGERTATVVAETDLRLLVLTRQELSSLLHAAPSVAQKIIGQLGQRLRVTDDLVDTVPAAAATIGPISI